MLAAKWANSQLFIAFMALFTTIWGYQFGLWDHQEHLSLLFRQLNPDFLPSDTFINANDSGFNPRIYSNYLTILLTKLFGLPLAFLLLCFLCNWAIGRAAQQMGRLLFKNELSANLAALFCLSIPTLGLGSVSEIHAVYLTPNSMAFALVLLALPQLWQQKFVQAGVFLALATLIHPLVGPESTLLLGGLYALSLPFRPRLSRKQWKALALGAGLFGFATALSLGPYFLSAQEHISREEFYNIYVHFRAPHHLLPSQFLLQEEPKNSYYLIGYLALLYLPKGLLQLQKIDRFFVLGLILSLLALAYIGYYFVEIQPSKLMATAQVYRMLYLGKFFFLLGLAGAIGQIRQGKQLDQVYAWAFLLNSFCWTNGLRIALLFLLARLRNRFFPNWRWTLALELPLLLALTTYGLWQTYLTLDFSAEAYLWLIFILFGPISYNLAPKKKWPSYLFAATSLSFLLFWSQTPRTPGMSPLQQDMSRLYSLSDQAYFQPALYEVSQYIKKETPKDSRFLVPPMQAEIRYLGQRALVVDFKAFPFSGQAMKAWQERIFEVYGWTDQQGFAAVNQVFEPYWKTRPDSMLLLLGKKYEAQYALLYAETETQLPVVFKNQGFQLVFLKED